MDTEVSSDATANDSADSVASPPAQDTTESSANHAEVSALRSKLQETESALKEQRSVQSGLDKQVNQLSQEREQLQSEIERLSELTMTDDVKSEYEKQLQEARSSAAELENELTSKLSGTESRLQQLESENERLRVLVGEFPHLSALVEADALPQAETVEEFKSKLERLSGTFVSKSAADEYARTKGARPPSSPGIESKDDLDSIRAKMDAARKAGDDEKYRELTEVWYETLDEVGGFG